MSTSYRLGTWNLHKGRAAGAVRRLMEEQDLDALAVQEVTPRVKKLRDTVRGFARVRLSLNREAGHVVRDGMRLTRVRRHKLTSIGWERGKGRPGRHPARKTASVRLGPRRGGIRRLSVHVPPKPDHWTWRGRARRQAMRRIRRIGKRWNRAIERGAIAGYDMSGDWNEDRDSPQIVELARVLGAQIKGGGVDFVLYRGIEVSDFERLDDYDESDHKPRVYTATTR